MSVRSLFDGDDDLQTAWEQHDVYGEALGVILRECRHFISLASDLLDTQKPIPGIGDLKVDHRTLQEAHDILAAVWRHRTNSVQPELFGPIADKSSPKQAWLSWLQDELRTWDSDPHLIRLTWSIIENQNVKIGYDAEAALSEALFNRYRDVPWKRLA
jgi:hypothetical protein